MSLLLPASDVIIVSDMESDSDDEVFNIDQITDRTGLLTHPQPMPLRPNPAPKKKSGCHGGRSGGGVGSGSAPSRHTWHGSLSSDSAFLLPADMEQTETLKRKKKQSLMRLIAVCFIGMLFAIALPLQTPEILIISAGSPDRGYTLITLGCLFGSMILSSALTPLLIGKVTVRWCVVAGCAGVTVFIVTKCTHLWPLIITGALVCGITSAPAIVALLTHTAELAQEFVEFGGGNIAVITPIFLGLYHNLALAGPLFSSLLVMAMSLTMDSTSSSAASPTPSTMSHSSSLSPSTSLPTLAALNESLDKSARMRPRDLPLNFPTGSSSDPILPSPHISQKTTVLNKHCGSNFCSSYLIFDDGLQSRHQSDEGIRESYGLQALLGCFIVFILAGLLLAVIGIKKTITRYDADCNKLEVNKDHNGFLSGVELFGQSNMLMVIPMFAFIGVQQIVGYVIFTQAFASCSLGREHATYMVLCLSGTCLVLSALAGLLCAVAGRLGTVLFAVVLQAALLIVLMTERDPSWPTWLYYLLAAFWSACDTFQQVAVTAAVAQVFSLCLAPALGQYVLWKTAGMLVVLSMQALHVCTVYQLTVALILLCISSFLYTSFEIKMRLEHEENRHKQVTSGSVCLGEEDASWIPNINPLHIHKERTQSLIVSREISVVDEDLVSM